MSSILYVFVSLNAMKLTENIRVLHKRTTLAIMPILAIEILLHENKKKSSDKMLPPVRIKSIPLINLWFQVQHSPFSANLASAR